MTHIRTLMDQMIQIDEGRMKDIFSADEEGQSAKQIAKALNLPLETVKKILGEESELKEFSSSQLDILAKSYAGMSGKTIGIDQANKLRKIFDKIPDSALSALRKKKIPFISGLALSRMISKGIPVTEDADKETDIDKIKLAKEKDTDSADAQIITLKGQLELLKQKLENEKNKVVKPVANKETGEVPLTVGIAHKYIKDKKDKEQEEVKEENLEEKNTDKYVWSDINKAMMSNGFSPGMIIKVLNSLRGKELKEDTVKEAPDPITYGPDKVAKAMKIAVTSDGQFSKAVREIEKIGKDLSKVSTIARALKTANEEKQMNEAKEKEMYYLEYSVDSSKEWVTGPDRVPGKPKAGPDRALAGIEVEEQVKAETMEEAFRYFKQVIMKYTNRMKGKLKLNVRFMGTFPRVSAENKRGERLSQQLSKDIARRTMRNEDYSGAKETFERLYKTKKENKQ